MSEPRIKWATVRNYFLKHGYQIEFRGGDAIIKAPRDGKLRSRNILRIGHRFCNGHGAELSPAYVKLIERHFGITRNELLDE